MFTQLKMRYKLLIFVSIFLLPALACGGEATSTSTPQISTATSIESAIVEDATDEEVSGVEDDIPTDIPDPTKEIEPTLVPTNTPAPTSTPEPQPGMLGDLIEQGGYSFAAVAVSDPAPSGLFYEETDGSRLVAVEVIVGNVSGETFSSNVLNGTLLDSDGFTYQPELGAGWSQLELIEVQPGERVRGWISFVIPNESIPAIINLSFAMGMKR